MPLTLRWVEGCFALAALTQVFGEDLDGHDDVDYFPDEHAFSATTIELMNVFSIFDEKLGSKADKDELVRNRYRDVVKPARASTTTADRCYDC